MKLKGYSKKRMFGLLLLPALACSMADGITASPAMAVTTTVASSTLYSQVNLTGTESLTVNNNGTIDVVGKGPTSGTAVVVGSGATGATIENHGQIIADTGYSAIYVYNNASGTTINNYAGACISAPGSGSAIAYGSASFGAGNGLSGMLSNAGTIFAGVSASGTASNPTGVYIYGNLAGTLENTGEIKAVAKRNATASSWTSVTTIKAHGLAITGDLTGNLTNTGTTGAIHGEVNATAMVTPGMFGSAYAFASGREAYGLSLGNIDTTGSLNNTGTTSVIDGKITSVATAHGTTRASATAFAQTAYGINMGDLSGALVNAGTISAELNVDATADGITQANAGASAYPAYGIRMGALNGSLSNAGTIEASETVNATATATGNGATGEAYAYAYGFTAYGVDMNSNAIAVGKSLINSGTIKAKIDVDAQATETFGTDGGSTDAYATAWNVYGLRLGTLDGTIENSGTLSAITAEMDATATAGGNTARAYASGAEVYGIMTGSVTALTGSLNNAGTISAASHMTAMANGVATATATAQNRRTYFVNGIRMTGGLSGALDNSGTIAADVTMAATAQGDGTTNAQNANAYAYGYNAYGLNLATGWWSSAGAYGVDGILSNTGTASAIRATLDVDATADGITQANAGASAYPAYGIRMGALNGSLSNAGTIEASETVNATATATGNGATGEAYAYAYGFTAYGVDMNSNAIAVGKSLINSGTIKAKIDVDAQATETFGTDGGSTDAYATAWNVYGLRLGTLDGGLTNSGTVSAITAEMGLSATATGDDVKAYVSGGSVYGVRLGDVTATTGSLSNAGLISATLTAGATADGVGNAIAMVGGVNYGPSTHTDYARRAYGLYMGNLAGSLINGGTIEANLTASADASATAGNAYASAIGSAACGISAVSSNIASTATFFNNGTIKGTLDVDATATATGTATAVADARYAGGVSFGDLSATLDNDGTISARVDATAVASGNLANAAAKAKTASALYLNSIQPNALLDNSGTIKAEAYAQATATGAVANASAQATAYGVFVNNLTAGGTLTNNSGTISATAKATAANVASAIADAVHVTTLDGTLNNNGTIQAEAYATATGATASAKGVYVGTLNGTLNNSNAISGLATLPQDGYSLYVNSGTGMVSNQAGGLLSGNLNVGGTVHVINNGTIAIPAGVAANVAGNYDQPAGGKLRIGAVSTASYGQLNVGGTAAFAPGTGIDVNVATVNTLAVSDVLQDVVKAGMLQASTFTVTDNSALLNFEALLDGNTVDLNATVVPLVNVSSGSGTAAVSGTKTRSSIAVGRGAGTLPSLLTEMLNNPKTYPGMASLLDALVKLETDDDVVRAVNSLLPFLNGDMKRAIFSALHETRRIIRARVEGVQGMNSGDDIAVDRNVWGKVFDSRADQDDSRGVSGYGADSYGIIFGADTELNARSRLGAALAYVKSDVDGDTIASQNGGIDSYQAILYGSYALGEETSLGWQADYAQHRNDVERHVPFMGQVAKGGYDSWSTHVGADLARRIAVGEKTALIPAARIDYTRIDEEGYTEKGAGALNLKVSGSEVDELIFGVDGKLTHNLTENTMLTANLGVGYDALADDESITTAFAGAPGSAFKTTGIDPEPWLVNAGVGAEFDTKEGVQLNVRYDIEGRDDYTNQSVSLKVKVPF